jgi:hypothetical protein
VIDRILWAVRRPNPVRDHQILVIAWWQYQRTALESITASLEDVDYVNFNGGIAPQVSYRLGRCDIGKVENVVVIVKDAFGERLGVPSSLTVATNDSIACLMIASMSAVISIIDILLRS